MDFFDDDDEPPTARPAKFQPRAKAKARAAPSKKAPSAAKPPVPRQAADNQHVVSPTKANVPNDDISDSVVTSNAGAKVSNNAGKAEQTTSLQTSSGADPLVSSMENVSTITGHMEENATSKDGGNRCESTVENLSTITGHMEENATSKDGGNQCENTGESRVENAEAFIRLDSADDSVHQSTSVAEDLTNSPTPVKKKQLSSKDTVASSNAGDTQMKRGQLEAEGGHAFTSSESFDLVSEVGASSGKRASKFQAKIKKKPGKKKVSVESASDPKDTFEVPSETQNMNQGSVDGGPDFPDVRVDDALSRETECMLNQDVSFETSPGFTPDLPSCTIASTDCLLNQAAQLPQSPSGFAAEASDQVNVNEAENNNGHNEEEGQPKKRKSSSRSNKDASGARKSARKSKKTIKGLEISNEETTEASEETTEANEETTEALEKPNEDAIGTRKTPRKRKKTKKALEKSNEETTEASEKPNKQSPKKFPRSTRRRNRCLDQSLLETPEDEIDYQSLPIKDLIMLAEHRERQLALEKKTDTSQPVMPAQEATAAAEPVKKTSDDVWGDNDDYDEYDDMNDPTQGGGSFDGPSTSAVERDTTYFNYHSHMNRTPRVKWTKQDTVLFYEGVRQFGSDLSMIQHLFPGRTRQQMKLKYKKEERQKPMELLDALTNRAKDLSHYKLVIARLQEQIDREEEQMTEEEASLGCPEEGTADDTQEQAQDEAAKSEQNGAVKDLDEAKVGSPAESTESDLDAGDWGEYKSEF